MTVDDAIKELHAVTSDCTRLGAEARMAVDGVGAINERLVAGDRSGVATSIASVVDRLELILEQGRELRARTRVLAMQIPPEAPVDDKHTLREEVFGTLKTVEGLVDTLMTEALPQARAALAMALRAGT